MVKISWRIINAYTFSTRKESTMKKYRNPINNIEAINVAGNVMRELKEADLNNYSAGAGDPKASGVVCTSTAECNYNTILFICC